MWRLATERDDDVLVELCRGLHQDDPGPLPVDRLYMRETLATLRREPWRGRAVALEVGRQVAGYALLISFWSNELGGEVCQIDELYVVPGLRGRGHGSALFDAVERGDLWPGSMVAMALGTSPDNARARRLYQRLGFATIGDSMVKVVQRRISGSTKEPKP